MEATVFQLRCKYTKLYFVSEDILFRITKKKK